MKHVMSQVFRLGAALVLAGTAMISSAEDTEYLGGLSPEDALQYMTTTEDLAIVDVREPKWIDEYFQGSQRIPWVEMKDRVQEIPAHKHVILNCGAGFVAPKAYEIIKQSRQDLLSLGYIAGPPLFKEYNDWLKKHPQP